MNGSVTRIVHAFLTSKAASSEARVVLQAAKDIESAYESVMRVTRGKHEELWEELQSEMFPARDLPDTMRGIMQDLSGGRRAARDKQAFDSDQERLYDALKLIAENDGQAYRKRDAKGAVARAWKEWKASKLDDWAHDFSRVERQLVKDLAARWRAIDRE